MAWSDKLQLPCRWEKWQGNFERYNNEERWMCFNSSSYSTFHTTHSYICTYPHPASAYAQCITIGKQVIRSLFFIFRATRNSEERKRWKVWNMMSSGATAIKGWHAIVYLGNSHIWIISKVTKVLLKDMIWRFLHCLNLGGDAFLHTEIPPLSCHE